MAETPNPSASNTDTDPSLNPISPYYLHPGENPGAVLVSPPLNGDNFHSWSRAMRRALLTKNKLKFVNGSISAPAKTNKLFDAWERSNTIVVSWINRSLSTHIAQSTIYIDNARSLWVDLHERYSRGNHFRVSDILQELHSLRQGDRSVSTFFTDLKTAWEELEMLRPTPACICSSSCTCNLTGKIKGYRNDEYVICFLKGLNDTFCNDPPRRYSINYLKA